MADNTLEFPSESEAKTVEIRPGRVIRVLHIQHQNAATPTIFMVHGFGGRLAQFRTLIEALKSRYTICAFDMLGHGKSEKPVGWELYAGKELVEDILAVFYKYRTDKNVFIGHSYGTGLSICALSKIIDNGDISSVVGVILLGSSYSSLRTIPIWYLPNFILDYIRPYMGKAFTNLGYHPSTPETIKSVESTAGEQNQTHVLKAVARQATWFTDADLQKVTVPCLLISGVADGLMSPDEAKKLKDHLPNANIVILDECAHFPMLEKPDETVDLILNFLNKQQQ